MLDQTARTPILWISAALVTATLVLISLVIATATRSETQPFPSSAGALDVETVASGLDHPWALAFLPDGQLLVTERPGRMRIIAANGKLSEPLNGLPPLFVSGQGGLLDVALDREFAQNRTLYFCFASPLRGGGQAALARARLKQDAKPSLSEVKVIFRQDGPPSSGNHYGCRIAQGTDGKLYLAMGEHFGTRDEAQNLANHLGKIVRLNTDGTIPADNPFVGRADARGEICSYGHRNPQGLTIHPTTGALWEHEHGPRGGDEINLIARGKNYGWPVIGYGIDYTGARIHEATARDGMEQPLKYWVPSIAPSGMAFYTGDLLARWKGNLFVGALAGKMLVRLRIDGERVVEEERLLQNLGERIRDVRNGPDGALWLLTDSANGRVLRITPAKN